MLFLIVYTIENTKEVILSKIGTENQCGIQMISKCILWFVLTNY